jgi:hypothetical protein
MTDVTLQEAVGAAARRPEVTAAVGAVYDAVRAEIDARKPACAISGRCCRFETTDTGSMSPRWS